MKNKLDGGQVTEAHRELLHQLLMNVEHGYLKEATQLIADSEAQANAELRAELARLDTEKPWLTQVTATIASFRVENDQLRAEVERLREYSDELDGVTNALGDALARAERAEREVERLRSETARIGKNGAEEYIRAERAEAKLKSLVDRF